ncbi:MAG: patatin-like phospholipase family protein [Pseudomonadota bacterium]
MTQPALTVFAGSEAVQRIEQRGISPEIFSCVVGASGGAKMLALTHLDRYLFGEFLPTSRHRVELLGSSIGSWRHAAAAAPDPLAALSDLQERYLNQAWDENDPRRTSEIVDELCAWVVDGLCTEEVARHVCSHPRYTTHVVTARGLGWNGRPAGPRLALGMGVSAAANMLTRNLLGSGFQRVVFSSGPSQAFQFSDFGTRHVGLTASALKRALLASGSIPFLMSGQQDLPGADVGRYWDGGIIDYHFDFANQTGDGLVLYPHFTDAVIKGWFDKALPWRRTPAAELARVVMLAPSRAYLKRLPNGRIPNRKDFKSMRRTDRLKFWNTAMSASQQLADAFAEFVTASEPARFLTRFP